MVVGPSCAKTGNAFKCIYSTALLILAVSVTLATIFDENTQLSRDVHPVFAFVMIWLAVLWLSMVEGGQAPLVGLPPVDKELYRKSHPITHTCASVAHKGDNLDRYLIGRQFLVILIVFLTNLAGRPLQVAQVLGLPDVILQIFLGSGLAMTLMTANIGQLASQVNASRCMLDYINTYFMVFTLYVAMAIEASGLLHSVYFVQMCFAKLSGKKFKSKEPPRGDFQNMFFFGRIYFSLAVLGFCFAVTLKAIIDGKTTMRDGVPKAVLVVLFFVLMSIVGMLEGMQIAFFAVAKLSKDEQHQHPVAMKTCDLLFKGEGRNLPGFMIGRQICVTMCFFFIARITTINVDVDAGEETIFGVSAGLQQFFNTGLPGAIITTIVASLSWQLVASSFPVAFLSNPLVYVLLRICLALDATGICSASRVLAWMHKRLVGFQKDEVYIGTPGERAAANHQDDEQALDVNPGHFFPGVPTLPRSVTRYQGYIIITLDKVPTEQSQLAVRLDEDLFPISDTRRAQHYNATGSTERT